MIRAWVADASGVRSEDPVEASRLAAAGTATAWIDFDGETQEEVTATLSACHIHPLVLEDMVMDVNRPKVDDYGDYIYLVVHSARWEDDRPMLREIDVVLGEHFLVTYHEGSTRSVEAAAEVLPRRPMLLWPSPARLLHSMLDVLVDHYLPIMDKLGEEIDALEDQVFEDGHPTAHPGIIRLKRGLSALRRVVGPQRDTVLALTRDEFHAVPAELRPYLRDVYDRLARIGDLLESFRDESGALLELQAALASNRLNVVIKRLTVIATVGLPLTVITGYYGMNFPLAEYRWPHGGAIVAGMLILSAVATWGVLRWKRWL